MAHVSGVEVLLQEAGLLLEAAHVLEEAVLLLAVLVSEQVVVLAEGQEGELVLEEVPRQFLLGLLLHICYDLQQKEFWARGVV